MSALVYPLPYTTINSPICCHNKNNLCCGFFTELWTEVFIEEENPFAGSRKDPKLFTEFNFSLVKHLMATPSFTTI